MGVPFSGDLMSNKYNKTLRPPILAVKFANILFGLGLMASALIVVYFLYDLYFLQSDDLSQYNKDFLFRYKLVSIFFGILLIFVFTIGLKININKKVNYLLLIISLVTSLYIGEIFLKIYNSPYVGEYLLNKKREYNAAQEGITYDARKYIEVYEELNKRGIEVYPNVYPSFLIKSQSLFERIDDTLQVTSNGLSTPNGKIFHLGGISDVKMFFSPEELGYYSIYKTDEHGFNNNKGLYIKDHIDILLTGDSFTEGKSVKQENNISGVLRKMGYRAVSLGMGGNGPLIEYANLVEYAIPLRPKVVLWVYYENDISDLKVEMESSLLMRYLKDEGFTQNLIERQDEIDHMLHQYLDQNLLAWKEKSLQRYNESHQLFNFSARSVFMLNKLSERITKLIPISLDSSKISTIDLAIDNTFRDILSKAKTTVSKWDGEFFFVFLPTFGRYVLDEKNFDEELRFRKRILSIVRKLDIPIIDIHKEVFLFHNDPESLYALRVGGHYNREGYRLVAEGIAKILSQRGSLTTN